MFVAIALGHKLMGKIDLAIIATNNVYCLAYLFFCSISSTPYDPN